MSDEIVTLQLVKREDSVRRTLFDQDDARYVIPIYQRAFAWGTERYSNRENEIEQLMDDIFDARNSEAYYLGSVIAARKGNDYEVIDGQQRLTALFLLFNCLGLEIEKGSALQYACRDRSNYSLQRIRDLMDDESRLAQPYEQSLYEGVKTIRRKIQLESTRIPSYCEALTDALEHVILFRICVPEGTDLNRYFEVMNTRGEQLEQHDVVKAALMRDLNDEERQIFSEVWAACRDMTGYVQMHFTVPRREALFGVKWQDYPVIGDAKRFPAGDSMSDKWMKLSDVISPTFQIDKQDGVTDNDERVRFESIIGFPHFLLHVLKVFITTNGIVSETAGEDLIGELLDDKLLIVAFNNVLARGTFGGVRINRHDFSWIFLDCLLKCRFLFDKYIVKREYKEEDSDGAWSLQELRITGNGGSKRPYYVKTEFREYREWGYTADYRKDVNRMLQACLRVSYTSPKVMHWITRILIWLYENDATNLSSLAKFERVVEGCAQDAVSGFVTGDTHELGVNTPHIVFNYLDYLLWRDVWDRKGEPFDFEFRNSVEHWHPQHPSDGMYGEMEHVDRFGNLCLIQTNVNAKFSNSSPESKKSTFPEMIAKGSLKLRYMAQATIGDESRTATAYWRECACERHESKMLEILRNAVASRGRT